ncbi:MAG: nitronate monooxygenase [Patescibacteria group bacterium]|nr:nitronate monooxygenase [Patescibacteria group bacterium]
MRKIIQGGMGIYIATPGLTKASSINDDALGTLSCTAAERIVPHILQMGDPNEDIRRAFSYFPFQEVTDGILKKYFIKGGKPPNKNFKRVPAFSMYPRADLIKLTVASSFALTWLAKEGHSNPISVNYLEKIQIPHIYHITGMMLAGADFITMGAGITRQIPSVLDAIASGGTPSYRVLVEGSKEGTKTISFNPRSFFGGEFPKDLKRPDFLPIISLDRLASIMVAKLPANSIQGFVIELPTAGGHNAPPRQKGIFDNKGQPIYGKEDEVNFSNLQDLGIPFWIAGSYASPQGLIKAQSLGAVGIQAGSIFALSDDSGMDPVYRKEIRRLGYRNELIIRTDPNASPTGFPFKVIQLPGTQSEENVYNNRKRICDRSALIVPYQQENGKVGFRCASEPVEDYKSKGGKIEDTIGARCLCNGLFSASGIGNPNEKPIFTMGDDVSFLRYLMKDENDSYNASDAIKYLLGTKM